MNIASKLSAANEEFIQPVSDQISYDDLFGNLLQPITASIGNVASLQAWRLPLEADGEAYFKDVFAGLAF